MHGKQDREPPEFQRTMGSRRGTVNDDIKTTRSETKGSKWESFISYTGSAYSQTRRGRLVCEWRARCFARSMGQGKQVVEEGAAHLLARNYAKEAHDDPARAKGKG